MRQIVVGTVGRAELNCAWRRILMMTAASLMEKRLQAVEADLMAAEKIVIIAERRFLRGVATVQIVLLGRVVKILLTESGLSMRAK